MAKKKFKEKLSDGFYTFFLMMRIVKMRLLWLFTYQRGHKVADYTDIKEIPKALRYGDDYKYDPPRDPVYHPTLIQKRIDKGTKIGDCDDHAIYWCTALVKSGLAKTVWYALYFWEGGEGHAICVFEGLDGKMYWGDYRNPYPTVSHPIEGSKIPDDFSWLYRAMKEYDAKQVSTAQMWEVKRINWRDVPVLKKAKWIEGPIKTTDFEPDATTTLKTKV